jgi:hypothetical protein
MATTLVRFHKAPIGGSKSGKNRLADAGALTHGGDLASIFGSPALPSMRGVVFPAPRLLPRRLCEARACRQ